MHRSIDQVRVYQTRSSMSHQRAHPTKLFLNKYYCASITCQPNKKTVPEVRKVVREDPPLELLLEKRLRYDPVKSVSLKTREYEKTKKEPKTHKREYLVSRDNQPPKAENTDYMTGDLVMAKCPGWPYHPAMVVLDPVIRGKAIGPEGRKIKKPKYVRIKKSKQAALYHVQFFGNEMFRCWIRANDLRPFTSWNAWKDNVVDVEMAHLKTDTKRKAWIRKVGAHLSRKADWNLSISEAEKASKLDRFERIELLTYQYVDKIEDEIEEVQ